MLPLMTNRIQENGPNDPISTCRHIEMHLELMAFENIIVSTLLNNVNFVISNFLIFALIFSKKLQFCCMLEKGTLETLFILIFKKAGD